MGRKMMNTSKTIKSVLNTKTMSFLESYKQNLFTEAMWKVEVEGFPPFYVDAKSAGQVKTELRKKLKKPDDIKSIERVQKADWKKDVLGRISGKDQEDEKDVEVKEWIEEGSLTDDLLVDVIKNVMKERIK
jgi:menaquinone-dependent protoporphyrinogen IX oxidase